MSRDIPSNDAMFGKPAKKSLGQHFLQ